VLRQYHGLFLRERVEEPILREKFSLHCRPFLTELRDGRTDRLIIICDKFCDEIENIDFNSFLFGLLSLCNVVVVACDETVLAR
jgi:hypothetical protein